MKSKIKNNLQASIEIPLKDWLVDTAKANNCSISSVINSLILDQIEIEENQAKALPLEPDEIIVEEVK